MHVAIFGSFGKRMLAPGWRKETALAFLGGGDGPAIAITAAAIFGSVDVTPPPQ